MSQTVDLLVKPELGTAHTALWLRVSHAQMHTCTRVHTHSETAHRHTEGRGRDLQKEQESNTNLVAIRDRSAARSS